MVSSSIRVHVWAYFHISNRLELVYLNMESQSPKNCSQITSFRECTVSSDSTWHLQQSSCISAPSTSAQFYKEKHTWESSSSHLVVLPRNHSEVNQKFTTWACSVRTDRTMHQLAWCKLRKNQTNWLTLEQSASPTHLSLHHWQVNTVHYVLKFKTSVSLSVQLISSSGFRTFVSLLMQLILTSKYCLFGVKRSF